MSTPNTHLMSLGTYFSFVIRDRWGGSPGGPGSPLDSAQNVLAVRDAAQPATVRAAPARERTTSSAVQASAYFAVMSNRFASWGPAARSAQQSVTTNVGNPAWTESTTEARTQPDVVAPHTSTVSTRVATSIAATEVPRSEEHT